MILIYISYDYWALHFFHTFNPRVYFAGSYSYPISVQYCIRSPINYYRTVLLYGNKIPMTQYAGKEVIITVIIPLFSMVIPEKYSRVRHRLPDSQFLLFTLNVIAFFIQWFYHSTETTPLNHVCVHGVFRKNRSNCSGMRARHFSWSWRRQNLKLLVKWDFLLIL